jgi:hypothetical protein
VEKTRLSDLCGKRTLPEQFAPDSELRRISLTLLYLGGNGALESRSSEVLAQFSPWKILLLREIQAKEYPGRHLF